MSHSCNYVMMMIIAIIINDDNYFEHVNIKFTSEFKVVIICGMGTAVAQWLRC